MVLSLSLSHILKGFMGSEGTFNQFPQDLTSLLPFDNEAKLFLYDSKGKENTKLLAEYVRNIGNEVVLIAHSMGGILAVGGLLASNRRCAPRSK
jgi:hypothetical protein